MPVNESLKLRPGAQPFCSGFSVSCWGLSWRRSSQPSFLKTVGSRGSLGVLESWSLGVLESWSLGVWKSWSLGLPDSGLRTPDSGLPTRDSRLEDSETYSYLSDSIGSRRARSEEHTSELQSLRHL